MLAKQLGKTTDSLNYQLKQEYRVQIEKLPLDGINEMQSTFRKRSLFLEQQQ